MAATKSGIAREAQVHQRGEALRRPRALTFLVETDELERRVLSGPRVG
jgi:hypothetical protein